MVRSSMDMSCHDRPKYVCMFCKTQILLQGDYSAPYNVDFLLVNSVENVQISAMKFDKYISGVRVVGEIECAACGLSVGKLLEQPLDNLSIYEFLECSRSMSSGFSNYMFDSSSSDKEMEPCNHVHSVNRNTPYEDCATKYCGPNLTHPQGEEYDSMSSANQIGEFAFALDIMQLQTSNKLRSVLKRFDVHATDTTSAYTENQLTNNSGNFLLHMDSLILRCD